MKKNLKYLLPLATLLLLLSACQEPEMEVFSSHPSVPSTTVLPKPSPTIAPTPEPTPSHTPEPGPWPGGAGSRPPTVLGGGGGLVPGAAALLRRAG